MGALSSEARGLQPPLLVIVTGPPAAGKTHLARRISVEYRLPLIDKDGIKETLFDSLGWGDRDWSKKLGGATYELMYYYARRELSVGRSLILESNFRVQAEPALRAMQREYGCRFLQVHCDASSEVLVERYRRRWQRGERHPGHVDEVSVSEVEASIRAGAHPPLSLDGELVCVDTTDFGDTDAQAVLSAVERALARDGGSE